MRTAERGASTRRTSLAPPPSPVRRAASVASGPALIVASVLIAMRGFAFADLLSNQHPDVLSFWLPRSCLLGRSLAAGHVPLWNPFEMAGTPFAADPQSGWLYLPWMLLSWLLPCGEGLRAFIVLQPILAGLGLFWFLRKERLHRIAASVGGLSLAMMVAASNLAISLPFAATLAWTPFVLVGASGFLSKRRWFARLGWLALGALAWGQVASAHLSHGLLVSTAVVIAYMASRTIRDIRAGGSPAPAAVGLALLFLAFLPMANLAILVPRFALITNTSLRGGYAALGGTLARISGVEDRPLPTSGIWSAWPFALASAPGAYAGAAVLLSIPAAFRAAGYRYLTIAFVAAGGVAYALTLDLFVGAGWFRGLVLRLPYGDVYLHNPGRLRYLVLLVGPVLGAIGLQGFLERLPSRREAAWWMGGAAVLFVGLPVLLGAHPERFVVFGVSGRHGVRGAGGARAPCPRTAAASMARGADGPIPPGWADRPVPQEPSRGGSLPQPDPPGRILQQGLPLLAGAAGLAGAAPRPGHGVPVARFAGILADPAASVLVLHPGHEPIAGLLQRGGPPAPLARGPAIARRPIPDRGAGGRPTSRVVRLAGRLGARLRPVPGGGV